MYIYIDIFFICIYIYIDRDIDLLHKVMDFATPSCFVLNTEKYVKICV